MIVVVILLIIIIILLAFLMRGINNRMKGGSQFLEDVNRDVYYLNHYLGISAKGYTEVYPSDFQRTPINAFIEYCYPKASEIDQQSVRYAIVNVIADINKIAAAGDVIIFRQQVGYPYPDFIPHQVGSVRVWTAISLGKTFGIINIPKTMNKMRADEFIQFNNTSIQIEFSEGLSAHKSNAIEFLLRNLPQNVELTAPSAPTIRRRSITPTRENYNNEEMYDLPQTTPKISNNELLKIIKVVQNSYDVIIHFMEGLDLSTKNENAIMKYINVDYQNINSSNFLSITSSKKFRLRQDGDKLKLEWASDL